MASCQSCKKIASRDFGSDPSICTPNFRESLVKHKYEPLIGELRRVSSGILHVGDSYKGVCDRDPATDKDSYKGDAREPLSKITDAESSGKPCTPKLISAMKGTREQLGMQPNKNLSVMWAPDVYDPPVTSESHTVKGGHRRCYRIVKKEPRKQKHSKNKSYKSSSCDRKSLSRKSMGNIDCRMMMSWPKTSMHKSFSILNILT